MRAVSKGPGPNNGIEVRLSLVPDDCRRRSLEASRCSLEAEDAAKGEGAVPASCADLASRLPRSARELRITRTRLRADWACRPLARRPAAMGRDMTGARAPRPPQARLAGPAHPGD